MNTLSKNKKFEANGKFPGFQTIIDKGSVRILADTDYLNPSQIETGHPGLWKPNGDGSGAVFGFPISALDGDLDFEALVESAAGDSGSILDNCLNWATSTANGELPKGWTLPSAEAIEELVPETGLIIRYRSTIREVKVYQETNRFSLQITLSSIPDTLCMDRRKWLRKLLNDANSTWHMVRFKIAEAPRTVIAEVNLTGVPPKVLRPLFESGFDSLRWIVAGLTETVDFIVQPDSASEALELLHAE